MNLELREEQKKDHQAVFNLIEKAFEKEALSDQQEQFLVERLRQSEAFVPELSIVAELNEEIVGHILLTKISIKNETNSFPSLALAPVSVLPDFHGKGIGGQLIRKAHEVAKSLGFESIVLLGHENYYPRFGYKRADVFDIKLPFEVPLENCMAIELVEDGLMAVNGVVEYDKAFFE